MYKLVMLILHVLEKNRVRIPLVLLDILIDMFMMAFECIYVIDTQLRMWKR